MEGLEELLPYLLKLSSIPSVSIDLKPARAWLSEQQESRQVRATLKRLSDRLNDQPGEHLRDELQASLATAKTKSFSASLSADIALADAAITRYMTFLIAVVIF
jgi:hypothetical protein